MNDAYVTDLDRIGMHRAARERIERSLGIRRTFVQPGKIASLESLEDLLKRDKERERDGFPRTIKFRRVLTGPGKVIVVPYVEEGKLFHGEFEPKHLALFGQFADQEEQDPDFERSPGRGDGEVGDVIGRRPLGGSGDDGSGDGGDGEGPGAGDEPGDHGFEEEAFEIGRELAEKLQLPNLKDKVKKVPTDEYTYDLTDRHRGSGQVLDKKETLRRIVQTNLLLGRIDKDHLDPTKMIVGPTDRVYRVLSQERVWKSKAVVFFVRDYSGSMYGEPTQALVAQHLKIYAWLSVQYEKRVVPRFIVHDTTAREVTAKGYFTLSARGGTFIASGYKKINDIVEGEALENDYNIYVFQGTDGDDGDDGERALPELRKILGYTNRMGVTLFKPPYFQNNKTPFEDYVERGGILQRKDVFRMYVMSPYNVTEEMNDEALKALLAQD